MRLKKVVVRMLNNNSCKNALPKDKPFRIYDEKGLYLEVMPNKSKYWRFKYRFGNKEKRLALGVYPEVSLKDARIKRDEARNLIRENQDPGEFKKAQKEEALYENEHVFENIFYAWYEMKRHSCSEGHARTILNRAKKDILPLIGKVPINQLKTPDINKVIQAIIERGAFDLASRSLQVIGQVFRFAAVKGFVEHDITQNLKGQIPRKPVEHYKSMRENDLPILLKAIENYPGNIITKWALNLLLLTFVRTKELIGARWEEVDLTKMEWRIPASRMKARRKHVVPLSTQAVAIFQEMQKYSYHNEFVFPSEKNPSAHMSNGTLLQAFKRMGLSKLCTPHGVRGTASTILNEYKFRVDAIERQLAHVEQNKVRGSYNHAEYLDERKEMMQWWADFLDEKGRGELL